MNSEFAVAVHAMVYLNHMQEVVSSEHLAENICTNPARVRKVMSKLTKAGLVDTKKGVVGGYRITVPATDITLSEIAKAMQATYVECNWKSGDTDMDCLVASGMAGIMDEIYERLNYICGKEMDGITVDMLDKKIFGSNL